MERKTEELLKEKALFHFGQMFEMTVLDAYYNASKERFIVEIVVEDEDNFFGLEEEKQHSIKVGFSFEERGENVIITDYRLVSGFLVGEVHFDAFQLFRGYTAKNNIFVDVNLVYEVNRDIVFSFAQIQQKLFYPENRPSMGNKGKVGSIGKKEEETILAKVVKDLSSFENLKQHLAILEQSDRKKIIRARSKVIIEMDEEIDDQDHIYLDDFFPVWNNGEKNDILHYVFRRVRG